MAHPASTPTRRDLTPALIALAARAESVLERLLPADTQAPQLHRAMRQHAWRRQACAPALPTAHRHLRRTTEQLDAAGAAVEMIHAYS
jgi:hypothetical protein